MNALDVVVYAKNQRQCWVIDHLLSISVYGINDAQLWVESTTDTIYQPDNPLLLSLQATWLYVTVPICGGRTRNQNAMVEGPFV